MSRAATSLSAILLVLLAGCNDRAVSGDTGPDAGSPRAIHVLPTEEMVSQGFGGNGHFNEGLDPATGQAVDLSICDGSFDPALHLIGREILWRLRDRCLPWPVLTAAGGLACQAGDVLEPSGPSTCRESCLEQASCAVTFTRWLYEEAVPRCSLRRFQDPGSAECEPCPCWRIARDETCNSRRDASPYAIEVLNLPGELTPHIEVDCAIATAPWGSSELAALPQCL